MLQIWWVGERSFEECHHVGQRHVLMVAPIASRIQSLSVIPLRVCQHVLLACVACGSLLLVSGLRVYLHSGCLTQNELSR